MALKDEIRDLLERAGTDRALAERLARYGELLLDAGRRVNLTGAKTAQALVPHLLDSLTAMPFVRTPLVDIGSGGGLPGIPLALATGAEVTLIEATAKKARFLEAALPALGLAGRVVARRAEEAAHDPELRGRFNSGTCRAVASAPSVAELVLPFLAPGGVGILQRGALPERERNALADAALMLGGRLESEEPLEGDRRILLVRKTGPTAGRFPRPAGVPTKRPLCL